MDIEGSGTTCFFETGTSTGDNGETCGNGFDNRDAKAFVTGGIDKGFCKVIEDGKVVVRDSTEEMKPVTLGERLHIVGLSAYGDKMEVGRQEWQGIDGKAEVLALLDGAYIEDEAVGQVVALTDVGYTLGINSIRETWCKTLIDETDAVVADTS